MKYIIAQKNSAGFKSAVVKQCRTWEEFVDYIYIFLLYFKKGISSEARTYRQAFLKYKIFPGFFSHVQQDSISNIFDI